MEIEKGKGERFWYKYDGDFDGLLTAVALIYRRREEPAGISACAEEQEGLFRKTTEVVTDQDEAHRFWEETERRVSSRCQSTIWRAFLSNTEGREMAIYRYLTLGMEFGSRVGGMLQHPSVAPLWRIAQQVAREAQRFLGFVRFEELSAGFYYARIAPDNRILQLIAPHFAERFRDQHWVIHDERRNEAVVYHAVHRQWRLTSLSVEGKPETSRDEERFKVLWRRYFQELAIAERVNPKLQRGMVPLKYRLNLTEFTDT